MFTDGDVTVQEGAGQVELTVFKFGINSRDVHVTFATLGGDAVGRSSPSSITDTKPLIYTAA